MEHPFFVLQSRGELACGKCPLPDLLDEGGMPGKRSTLLRMRVEYPDMVLQLIGYDFYRFQQIGIVCDQNRLLKIPLEAVVEQMRRQIHIRSFFFRLHDRCVFLVA